MRTLLVTLLILSCGKKEKEDVVVPKPTPTATPIPALTDEEVQQIVVTHCIGCHQPPTPKGNVDLTAPAAGVLYRPQLVKVLEENTMPPRTKLDELTRKQLIKYLEGAK
jgi:mono/diheme cytochrome c family protein